MSKAATKACPFCAETIQAAALLCRFCGRDLPPPGALPAPVPVLTPETSSAAPLQEAEVLDLLASLVQKSLVVYEEDEHGQGRYRLLEPMRQYARDRLVEGGAEEAVRDRHRDWFLALAEGERDRPERLLGERDNLRAALGWVVESGDVELAFRFGEALFGFWWHCGPFSEGQEYLAKLLALLGTSDRLEARAHTLDSAGALAYRRGDYGAARTYYEESLTICQELGQRDRVASRHLQLGLVARQQGDSIRAVPHLEQSLVMAQEVGDQDVVADSLLVLGGIARSAGDLAQAAAHFQECLAVHRKLNHKAEVAQGLAHLAIVANDLGDQNMLRALHEESMALSREGDIETAYISMDQGSLLLELGDYAAARARFEEGLAARRAWMDSWWIASALVEVGHAAWLQGEAADAQSHAVEALGLFRELGNQEGILITLESLAVAALAQGRQERAARLMGAAVALREAVGHGPPWWLRPRQRMGEAVRAASLEQTVAAAWAAGRALSLDEAVAFALKEADPS